MRSVKVKRYNIEKFGENMKKRRLKNYKKDADKYKYCKTQTLFSEMIESSRKKDETVTPRTIINWEKNNKLPDLKQFVELCEVLECDADYLLGIQKEPLYNLWEIGKKLNLPYQSVEYIERDSDLQDILGFMLMHKNIPQIIEAVKQFYLMQLLSDDLLQAYEEALQKKIEKAYINFVDTILPISRDEDTFKQFLCEQISFNRLKGTKEEPNRLQNYIKDNLNDDRFQQIQNKIERKKENTEKVLYDAFIDDIILCTYKAMEYKYNKDAFLNKITYSVMQLIEEYTELKQKELKRSMKRNAKRNAKNVGL